MYDVCNGIGPTSSATFQLTVGSGSAGSPQGVAINDVVMVCAGNGNAGGNTISGVTDTQSHVYTQVVSNYPSTNYASMWTTKATHALVAGTDKITVTYTTASGQKPVVVKGLTGATSATPDQTNSVTGTSTAPDAGGTGVLAQASEVVVGVIVNANSGGQPGSLSSGGSGVTAHTNSSPYLCVFSQTVNSTVATDASGKILNSAQWTCLVATFKLSTTPLTVTSTSPPNGTIGTAYNGGTPWPFAASGGTPPYTWAITKGVMPPGLSFALSSPGHIGGATITWGGPTASQLAAEYTKWATAPSAGYGIYPLQTTKVYKNSLGGYPTYNTAALWESNAPHVGSAMLNGYKMILCFDNVFSGTTNPGNWPGGAIFPSSTVMSGIATQMQATIQALVNVCAGLANGSGVAGIIFINETDGAFGPAQPFQSSYQYFYFYPILKAAFPNIPIYVNFIWYPGSQTVAAFATEMSQRFPGPSPINPSGWGGSSACYCDGLCTDIYASQYDANDQLSHLRYFYAEPAYYTPPAGPGLAGSGSPGPCDIADYNGIAWGNIESGNSGSGTVPPIMTVQQYLVGNPVNAPVPIGNDVNLHSMLATYQFRIANDLPVVGMEWFENLGNHTANPVTSSSDVRVPWLKQLDAATAQCNPGNLSGVPTGPNANYPITIQVTDASGNQASANITVIIGTGTLPLSITTPPGALANGASGQSYTANNQNIAAQGGSGFGYTFTINSGTLSGSGLTLNSNGAITGTCTTVVSNTTYTFTVKVTDSASNTAISGTFTITILPTATTVVILNTDPLPAGTVGQEYVQSFSIQGGTPPYTVALASGSNPLPPGLVIDNNDPIDDQAGNPITDQAGGNLS